MGKRPPANIDNANESYNPKKKQLKCTLTAEERQALVAKSIIGTLPATKSDRDKNSKSIFIDAHVKDGDNDDDDDGDDDDDDDDDSISEDDSAADDDDENDPKQSQSSTDPLQLPLILLNFTEDIIEQTSINCDYSPPIWKQGLLALVKCEKLLLNQYPEVCMYV
jgi:hypothetical protein